MQSRDKDNTIFGLVRNPEASTEFAALEAALRNVHVVRGDITDRAALKVRADPSIINGFLDDSIVLGGRRLLSKSQMSPRVLWIT